jgi:excisionase family DNA binding protein
LHQRLKVRVTSTAVWGRRTYGLGNAMVDLKSFEDAHYLTVAEVALAMRVSKMTVYRLVHEGELPAVRFGRSYRVPAQAVQEYLVADRHTAAPAQRKSTT